MLGLEVFVESYTYPFYSCVSRTVENVMYASYNTSMTCGVSACDLYVRVCHSLDVTESPGDLIDAAPVLYYRFIRGYEWVTMPSTE